MASIKAQFKKLKSMGQTGLVPYLTAGDPHLEATADYLKVLEEAGADLIEVGVPFSDPVADGPVNQKAADRALSSGTTLEKILKMLSGLELSVPIILFTYFNPLYRMGLNEFATQAKAAGVSGVLVVDLPPAEGAHFNQILSTEGLESIYLATPTTEASRLNILDQASTGALYYVARMGVTGKETQFDQALLQRLSQVRQAVNNPLMVGFGIANPEQVKALKGYADALVVGSALVRKIEENPEPQLAAPIIKSYIQSLKQALEAPQSC